MSFLNNLGPSQGSCHMLHISHLVLVCTMNESKC